MLVFEQSALSKNDNFNISLDSHDKTFYDSFVLKLNYILLYGAKVISLGWTFLFVFF